MIKVAICDDDIHMTSYVEELLLSIASSHSLKLDIDVFYDGIELEEYINQNSYFDLIYLDIVMKYHDGLTTAKNIRKLDNNVIIIFISRYECYLKELFEVLPLGFINKPIDTKDFIQKFTLAYDMILKHNFYYDFKYAKDYYRVAYKDIMYFESKGHTIFIYLINGAIKRMNNKLDDIEKEITKCPLNFLRIHQSYYVNNDYIEVKKTNEVILTDGTTLHISENNQKRIREQYKLILRTD